jgi:UDP-N-acetylmuramate: L-alanyl-gamma-D-glutamyl-meso-diaminopimelate ligase
MELTPKSLYQENTDRQRIVIVGAEASKLAAIVTNILKTHNRKFNHYGDGKLTSAEESPIIIIEAPISADLPSYQHHIGIFTTVLPTELDAVSKFADATSKCGILIYPENDAKLKAISTKERPDVQSLAYKAIPHEVKDGKTYLVSSTNEKFLIALTGAQNLLLLAAAKELLKKIGISSGQFYRAVSNFQ